MFQKLFLTQKGGVIDPMNRNLSTITNLPNHDIQVCATIVNRYLSINRLSNFV